MIFRCDVSEVPCYGLLQQHCAVKTVVHSVYRTTNWLQILHSNIRASLCHRLWLHQLRKSVLGLLPTAALFRMARLTALLCHRQMLLSHLYVMSLWRHMMLQVQSEMSVQLAWTWLPFRHQRLIHQMIGSRCLVFFSTDHRVEPTLC